MSRKHNSKHHRSPSQYPERLAARGESSATVRMPFIDRKGRKYPTVDAYLRRNRDEDEHAEAVA